VFGRLSQLDILPARLCSDAVFVRHAYLDVIGTLPTTREAGQSIAELAKASIHAIFSKTR
jgi:hypothetical protein